MVSGSAPIAANKVVQKNLAYDPQVDFTSISIIAQSPALLSASASAPAQSLQDLVAYAKANPGQVNIGNPGAGTKGHIAAAIIGQMAGVEINHIPYKGSPPLLADLLGGHIDFALDAPSNYLPHLREKKIRALAVTSAVRAPELPDVPTVQEVGFKDYEQTLWFGAVGPKDMRGRHRRRHERSDPGMDRNSRSQGEAGIAGPDAGRQFAGGDARGDPARDRFHPSPGRCRPGSADLSNWPQTARRLRSAVNFSRRARDDRRGRRSAAYFAGIG